MTASLRRNERTRVLVRLNGLTILKSLVAFALVVALICVLVSFMLPAQRVARGPARRSQCKNNLKQIALALHNYVEAFGALPPAYTVDAEGKPLHSWRTLILPYLDEKKLYDKIDLTKPWDDPVNEEASQRIIEAYRCPEAIGPPNHTSYLGIVSSNSCFRSTAPRLLSEITDKHSETIFVIEVHSEHGTPWMSPRDADESLLMSLGPQSKHSHTGGFHVACVDGTVRFVNATIPPAQLRALISIAGDEKNDF